MSFSNQATVSSSLVIKIWLLIMCIKVLVVNSCQQYDDSEDEKKAPKVYKHWQINENKDEERQDLSADYENDGYILFPPPFKVSNRPVNLDKGTRSLTHLVSIESKKY